MIIARLLYSVGNSSVTEYPDFNSALADLKAGSNRDFVNMSLEEYDVAANQIGRIMDGLTINEIVKGNPPPVEGKNR